MLGSVGSGRIAFEQSAATFPGVSCPSSVVRSQQRIASSSAQTFASFLMLRFASSAARCSTATWSIAPMRGSRCLSGSSKPLGSAGAFATVCSVDRWKQVAPWTRSAPSPGLICTSCCSRTRGTKGSRGTGPTSSSAARLPPTRASQPACSASAATSRRSSGTCCATSASTPRATRYRATTSGTGSRPRTTTAPCRASVPRDGVWHWLAVAKHHGLSTRMLDWTYSPYVALHFATSLPANFGEDGLIWMVDFVQTNKLLPDVLRRALEDEGMNATPADLLVDVAPTLMDFDRLGDDFVVFFEPPALDERIVNQYALFSLMPSPRARMDDWLGRHPGLARQIVLPAELKWEVRDKLDQANITERVLFPGLDGLATWLKRYFSPRQP